MIIMRMRGVVIVFLILVATNIASFLLWKSKSNDYDTKCQELISANSTIDSLKADNEKLLEYTKLKNQELENIEESYKEKLNNVPKDSCGDEKPSQKLLTYLRGK